MSTKISIVNVKNYDSILDAIEAGIILIAETIPFDIRECKNILIKPNLLRATKDACTQPVFVEAVLKYLKNIGVVNFINGEYPEFLRRKCISCLCCMEMCPQEAIKPKLRGFGGLFHSY